MYMPCTLCSKSLLQLELVPADFLPDPDAEAGVIGVKTPHSHAFLSFGKRDS